MMKQTLSALAALAMIGAPIASAQTPRFIVKADARSYRPGDVYLAPDGCYVDLATSTARARLFVAQGGTTSTLSIDTASPSLKSGDTMLLDVMAGQTLRAQPFAVTDGEDGSKTLKGTLAGASVRKLDTAESVEVQYLGKSAYTFAIKRATGSSLLACLAHLDANPADPFAS